MKRALKKVMTPHSKNNLPLPKSSRPKLLPPNSEIRVCVEKAIRLDMNQLTP
jgi:hypothetical protein